MTPDKDATVDVRGTIGTVTPRSDGAGLVFDLTSLGWKAFQDLCGTILGAVLGQTVVAFRPTADQGRDFAFRGEWSAQSGESLEGRFVVQCKFKARGSFFASDLTEDLKKVRNLVRRNRCDIYILMTNAPMTASTAEAIATALEVRGVKHSLIIGADQIDRYIRESSRLRGLVPRLYGLGDLTEILDSRRYEQATALLEAMRDEIAKFVITDPYLRALRSMTEYGFVLLLGEAAAGKSMIASALAAASVDMWGSRPVKVESAGAFASSWNPNVGGQLFWIDDAWGATQYQRQRSDEWNQVLPQMKAAVARGTRFVMTSRDYVWSQARQDMKHGSFPELETGQVIVDVHALSLENKREILYNHLKFGSQPKEFRSAVKPFLEPVAGLPSFLPDVARRFGDRLLTKSVQPTEAAVLRIFEHPVEHLEQVVSGLAYKEFAGLALIFMAQGARSAPVSLSDTERTALERLGTDLSGAIEGLEALSGSLTILMPDPDSKGSLRWSYKHPTVADAMARKIASRYELLQIYLMGSPLEALLKEVTCGDVGIEGALVVPQAHFNLVAGRLGKAPTDYWTQKQIADFLVTRCDGQFLGSHGASLRPLEIDPDQPGSLRIATRLRELGLLAEPVRAGIVRYFRRMAVDWLDVRILTDTDVRDLARPEELEAAKDEIRKEVIVGLSGYVENVGHNYDREEDPDDVLTGVRQTLAALMETYADDEAVIRAVNGVADSVDDMANSIYEKWRPGPNGDDSYDFGNAVRPLSGQPHDGPSIFDDVDE